MKSFSAPQRFLALFIAVSLTSRAIAADDGKKAEKKDSANATFSVGFGKRDITPQGSMPMWGYGARHDLMSDGVLDDMYAKAVVIQAGGEKLAIVGLDIGRGPTGEMTERIRKEIEEKAGIKHVMMSGSHTHHGPCIELLDRPGYGKGRFDAAVAYNLALPGLIIEAILEADKNAQPAKMAVVSKDVEYNRNRQTKRPNRVTDPMLAVVRFDDEAGKPIAVLVNFAAHPVMTKEDVLKFSADYPGHMQRKVEAEMKTNCMFMQGASGDLSPNPPGDFRNPKAFGELLADHVIKLARTAEPEKPAKPSIQGKVDHYVFPSRIDFKNPFITATFQVAFFPELVRCFMLEMKEGIKAELNTVLLNGEVALVGGSGEFFCNHSNRLKERSYVGPTLFFGYCNDHNMYFPTIEAVSEGGYGADMPVSPVAVGAGEQLMNQALINIYDMAGRIQKGFPKNLK